MSNYDILVEIPKDRRKQMAEMHVLRPTIELDLEIYEHHRSLCTKMGRMQARLETADKFCTSEETIKRVIKRLN